MTQVFAKRFWGFDPSRWPIIAFGLEANRDALVKASRPGDLVVFVGTKDAPTEPEEQGKVLGLAEIGRIPVDSLDVIDPANIRPFDRDADGTFKWPKALPMLRAWRFKPQRLVTDVLERQLTYEATIRAVLLGPPDANAVLDLPREEIEVPELTILKRHRELADALGRSGPTTGPAPTSWSGVITRGASSAATTYAFRFGKRDIWKIGHAQDIVVRLSEVNKHVPFESLGEQWSLALHQTWKSQSAAYEMEQRLLVVLSSCRTEGERVRCTEDQIRAAWISAMVPSKNA